MLNIFLFLALVFIFTFIIGRIIEKIHIPWVFAALILGSLLAFKNPFSSVTSSQSFVFLAQLGMYFLLFVIGFEIDLKEMKKKSKFIFKATFFIILFEALFGSLLLHFVFGYGWLISCLVALSFATVGEAMLVPILDKFKVIKTKLGQTLIGIGAIDDIIEIVVLISVIGLIGLQSQTRLNVSLNFISLFFLFLLTIFFINFKKKGKKFGFQSIETLFLFSLFVLFLFLGVGKYSESTALAALLAGLSLKTFIPKERLRLIEKEIKSVCYGLFAPLFFLWVGLTMNINYLVIHPLLVLVVMLVSNGTKIFSSYLIGKKELGTKKSILLGIGLSVRFSTSLIIIKILFENGLIGSGLYSVLIASSILQKFIVPLLFSNLLVRWKIARKHKS
ncbi:hypothetical protein B6U82_00040 [Candidatus Pacearchaeota archaeon ex4484_31]|nr:MAG: hypothetical protein B6U82_00040 [Candidatus Pacearchaeota archaeon ex4484_31]